MSATKEDKMQQITGKFSEILIPVIEKLDSLSVKIELISQKIDKMSQSQLQMQLDTSVLQVSIQNIEDSKNTLPIISTIKKNTVDVELPVKKFKTANLFLKYALENEEEFHLKDKFIIISQIENKMVEDAKEPIEILRTKKDFYKKLSTEVWKTGNKDEIKKVHNSWNILNATLSNGPSLEEEE